MLDLITCRVMAISIVKLLIAVGRALQEVVAAIRAKVIWQTGRKNRTKIFGSADVETSSLRAPWSFSLGTTVYVSGSGLDG